MTALGVAFARRSGRAASVQGRVLANSALVALVCGATLLAGAAAGGHTSTVPAQHAGFPGWLRGPLPPIALHLATTTVVVLLLGMYAAYVAAVRWADDLSPHALAGAIVAVTAVFALGPLLFSRDALGYVGYSRLGALHGLNPYAHGLDAAPHDAVFPWIGWRHSPTPYGPVFTVASYVFAHLGVPAALWAWKVVAAGSALGCSALLGWTARRQGRSGMRAAALFGLNPVVCAFGVGGAHNDLLLVLLVTSALALAITGRSAASGVALVAAGAMKATALVGLPFMAMGLRPRRPLLTAGLVAAAAAATLALLVFGTHVTGMLGAMREQQTLVSTHSVPNTLGRILGFGGITPGIRAAAAIASAVVVVGLLVWTARGADWIDANGWAVLALFLGSAWLMPWYAIVLLPFSALTRSRALAIAGPAFGALVVALRLPAFG